MKVGFVLLDGELTGGQVVALQLVRGVRAAGHDAVAVLPVDGPIRALLEEAGATVRITQLTRSYRVDQAVTLARLLSRDRIDIVDTHTLYVGNQLAAIAARLARIPLVVHSHIEERYHPSGAVRSAQRLLNRLTRGDATTVAVSGYLRDLLVRQGGDPGRI
ncbi:MAG TPA: glycosyltransferase, partial [Gaiellaceae bacterium]